MWKLKLRRRKPLSEGGRSKVKSRQLRIIERNQLEALWLPVVQYVRRFSV